MSLNELNRPKREVHVSEYLVNPLSIFAVEGIELGIGGINTELFPRKMVLYERSVAALPHETLDG